MVSSKRIEGPFNYRYSACLCDDYPRTFYWDFQVNSKYRSYPREDPPIREGTSWRSRAPEMVQKDGGAAGRRKGAEELETVPRREAYLQII